MAILNIENDIIEQLQTNIADLTVEAYPENPDEYKLLHSKGAILVRYQGASYSVPLESSFIQQTVNMDFNITLMIKGLRDKSGAYNYIDKIISVLTGYKGMYPVKVGFVKETAGIWQYSIMLSLPAENYSP